MSFLTLFAAGKSVVGMGDKVSPYRMRPTNRLPKFESRKNPFAPKAPESAPVTNVQGEASMKAKPALMETGSLFDFEKPVNVPSAPVEVVLETQTLPMVDNPFAENAPVVLAAVVETKMESIPAPLVESVTQIFPVQPEIPVAAPVRMARQPLRPKVSIWKHLKEVSATVVAFAAAVYSHVKSAIKTKPGSGRLPVKDFCKNLLKASNPVTRLRDWKAAKVKPATRPKQVELSLEKVKVIRNHLNDADLEIKGAQASEKKSALVAKLQPLAAGHTKRLDRLSTRFFGASSNQLQTHAQCQITTTIQ